MPTATITITTHVDQRTYDALQRAAKRENISQSAFIRQALEHYLGVKPKGAKP